MPPAAIANPGPAVASAVALALQLGVDGFSIDDEYDCAPRSTLKNFTSWVGFIDELATGLHTEKLELSVRSVYYTVAGYIVVDTNTQCTRTEFIFSLPRVRTFRPR